MRTPVPSAPNLPAILLSFVCLTGAAAAALADPPPLTGALSRMAAAAPREARLFDNLQTLYEAFGYQPIWGDPRLRRQLEDGIASSALDGLNPADYALPERDAYAGTADREAALNQQDVLLSRSLLMLLSHLYFGKLDPTLNHADWNLQDLRKLTDDPELIPAAIRAGDIATLLEQARPQQVLYPRLKAALAEYRAIAAGGGWPLLPSKRMLATGMSDPLIPQLRRRLALTGDYAGSDAPAQHEVYDQALTAAVQRFQRRHLLADDGVIGPATWRALNVPAAARIDQIRANLERMRWALKGLQGEFLLVDIAGFAMHLVRDDEVLWTSPVQVGNPYRQTPVLSSTVRYLEWNPTWTIPPTILDHDVIPAIQRNPDYLASKHMVVLTHGGQIVDPDTIDWRRYPQRQFPYLIRQLPGPDNALGTVKFIFPNQHAVYLHDTPSKALFKATRRAFSSGCIRVGKPYELARILLRGQRELSDADIQAILAAGKTRRDHLDQGLPIVILYWTTKWLPDGSLVFAPDLYDRDARIVAGLDNQQPAAVAQTVVR